MRRVLVLLKQGALEAVECESDDVFVVARVRDAGICGVFDDHKEAEAYMDRHRLPMKAPQSRLNAHANSV